MTTRLLVHLVLALLCPLGGAVPTASAAPAAPAAGVASTPLEVAAEPGPEEEVGPVGVWPLDPEPKVVAPFDPPDDPYGPGHRGVDLAGRAAQPVRAALAGTVTFAGRLAGRGVVVVSHGRTRTTYEPVSATVSVGDRLSGGGTIGRLEVIGSHCFPAACLHWGLRQGETYLDPLTLVGGSRRVRLLPLWREQPAHGPLGPPGPLALLPYAPWLPLVDALDREMVWPAPG